MLLCAELPYDNDLYCLNNLVLWMICEQRKDITAYQHKQIII